MVENITNLKIIFKFFLPVGSCNILHEANKTTNDIRLFEKKWGLTQKKYIVCMC